MCPLTPLTPLTPLLPPVTARASPGRAGGASLTCLMVQMSVWLGLGWASRWANSCISNYIGLVKMRVRLAEVSKLAIEAKLYYWKPILTVALKTKNYIDLSCRIYHMQNLTIIAELQI